MSRNKIEIDWKKVDDLLMAGCTIVEIAGYFGCDRDTIYIRFEKEFGSALSAYAEEKRQKGQSILRAHQYAKALGLTDKGDNTLLIWLGKTRLQQREEQNNNQNQKICFEVNYKNDLNDKIQISPQAVSTSDPTSSQ